jgi:tRNA pseudouridine38-40 synthase
VTAGRTDAGARCLADRSFDSDRRAQNGLTRGVIIRTCRRGGGAWARAAAEDFHARFAATPRHYTYLLLTRAERPGLLAGTVGWYHHPLDIAAMNAAATHLLGTHDFSAFRAAECEAKTPVKTLTRVEVTQQGPFIRIEFSANAFLHHMVRNIVGALVFVGAGRQAPGWLAELLGARDRTRAAPTFAADGLYLAGATYDARFGLPPTVRAVTLPAALAAK